jgi:4-aminobutyrate aminotransferase-like enzyme
VAKTQKILELNAFDPESAEGIEPATERLIARRQKTFGATSMLFYKRPLHIVRAEGVWLIAADGMRYLDAYNNVPSIGHCHPAVVEAVTRQMGILNTHSRYLYDNVYDYAERLLATMPDEVSNVVFTCTGSESVDLALRIARTLTGGDGIIVTQNAYHGNTSAVTDISPSSASSEPHNTNVFVVPAPDTYRSEAADIGAAFAASVQATIGDMQARGIKLAAFVADSIFSSDGVFPGPPGFLAATAEVVREAGGLYIADEVQPGFARTGEAMWGFARHGIIPDIVALGKPMGNGYPMGGVALKPDLLAEFGAHNGYFNTFGGSPVAAAAGMAVLETIASEGLQKNALDTGAYLLEGLKSAARDHASVGDVRGCGLYLGVEFVQPGSGKVPDSGAAERVVNAMRERGVLIGTAGLAGNVLKIRPPLPFARTHADILVGAFSEALAETRLE